MRLRPQLTVCRYFLSIFFSICLHTFGRQRHWNALRWPPAILLRDLMLLINTHKDKVKDKVKDKYEKKTKTKTHLLRYLLLMIKIIKHTSFSPCPASFSTIYCNRVKVRLETLVVWGWGWWCNIFRPGHFTVISSYHQTGAAGRSVQHKV